MSWGFSVVVNEFLFLFIFDGILQRWNTIQFDQTDLMDGLCM